MAAPRRPRSRRRRRTLPEERHVFVPVLLPVAAATTDRGPAPARYAAARRRRARAAGIAATAAAGRRPRRRRRRRSPRPNRAAAFRAAAAGAVDVATQQNVARPAPACSTRRCRSSSTRTFGYYGLHAGRLRRARPADRGRRPVATRARASASRRSRSPRPPAIDPYLDGAVFLTIPNLEGIEVEEAYLVTTSLPANLQIKAGTFRSQVGRNNTQHLHLQNFTRRPLMTALLFGIDGFRGPGRAAVGAAAAALVRHALRRGVQHRPRPRTRRSAATFGGGVRATPEQPDLRGRAGAVLGARRSDVAAAGRELRDRAGVRLHAGRPLRPGDGGRAAQLPLRRRSVFQVEAAEPRRGRTAACNGRPSTSRARSRTAARPKAPATRSRSCRSRGGSTSARASTWSALPAGRTCRAATATRRR